MAIKFFIKTYGCQMNQYDSSRISDLLVSSGRFEPIEEPMQADFILCNTCSVREKAAQKLFSDLGRFRSLKLKKPELIIAVGGCIAQQTGQALIRRIPYIDILFGPQTLHRILIMYDAVRSKRRPQIDISLESPNQKFIALPPRRAMGPSAEVTIMEGCNHCCSYCLVPFTRGPEVSRPFQEILKEVHQLIEQGVKEVIFLGQNVNNYLDSIQKKDLVDLIQVTAQEPLIQRIRYLTSNPFNFSEDLITLYANEPKLAGYLHLPVQSGSNRVLQIMRRFHSIEEYCKIINRLRSVRPDIAIGSDFIVGFPGETETDFQATLDLIDHVGFDRSFAFMYSPRPRTNAAQMVDDVSLAIKQERLLRLQQALWVQSQHISHAMLGSRQLVLILGCSKKDPHMLIGRTDSYRLVKIRGSLKLIGQFIPIKVTTLLKNELYGERL